MSTLLASTSVVFADLSLEDIEVKDNAYTATQSSGSNLYGSVSGYLSIVNSEFSNNIISSSGQSRGGIIYYSDSTSSNSIYIDDDTSFSNNVLIGAQSSYGAAVVINNNSKSLDSYIGGTFSNNLAISTLYGGTVNGGALYIGSYSTGYYK